MAKLPPRKTSKMSKVPLSTSSRVGTVKAQSKKKLKKKNIKKNAPSDSSHKPIKKTGSSPKAIKNKGSSPKPNKKTGSCPKPTKTTGSKPRPSQMKKKTTKTLKTGRVNKLNKKGRGQKPKYTFGSKRKTIMKLRKLESKTDEKLIKKYTKVEEAPKPKKNAKVDPTQLINLEMLQAAVSGLRKLPSVGKIEGKSLHDLTDEDERHVYLQVTLCKLTKVTEDFHLHGPSTVSVYLPNTLATDNTDVILITKDLQRGIKKDHQNTIDHFKELLHKHEANSLVNEVIPLRQLKVEYREFEAKRVLANRTDVLLCDDTVMRFIPKFLTKHFYTKKKVPVQVNLKAKDLQKELLRALSVSRLFFTMKGNCSIMKIGRLSQTDEEIQENILAAVQKLASHAPGKWNNIQGLGLKLERTPSIPIYVKMDSLNNVKPVPERPLYPGQPVSGTLSTLPGRGITVFPDRTVTVTSLKSKEMQTRIAMERKKTKEEIKKAKETKSKGAKKGKSKQGKETSVPENNTETPEIETEIAGPKEEAKEKKSTKRKAAEKKTKAKKQKKAHDSDSDSEADLEEQEMMYLRQLGQREEETAGKQKEEESEEDVWADSESEMEDSD